MSAIQLSIALPVRNGENYLREAIDSILAQSYGDFELVVSDNASTDATPDILADYARLDRRIKVSRLEELIPQVPNINRAVSLASGSWVKIFCHDDLMREDCMAQIAAELKNADDTGLGLISNGERHLFPNGYLSTGRFETEVLHLTGREAIVETLGGTSRFEIPALTTATVRKTAFEAVGGLDGRYKHLVDNFCWMEVLTKSSFAYLPEPLTVNRIHAGQVAAILTRQMSSTDDLRRFVPDFIARHGAKLDLPPAVTRRARLRAPSEAATKIVTEWMSGRTGNAFGMLRLIPIGWLPLLPALCVRAWLKQRLVLKVLLPHVPRSMIYP